MSKELGRLLYEEWLEGGETQNAVAERHGVNPNSGRRLIREYRQHLAAPHAARALAQERQYPQREVDELYPEVERINELAELDADELRDADIEELLTICRLVQRQMAKIDPVITHQEIVIPASAPVPILLAGCFQTGGRWTFHSFIQDRLEEMFLIPNARLGTFGDETENFMNGSFAGARSVFEQSLTPPLQRKLWGHWMDKYADRILWGTASQHGTMWDERQGFNPVKNMYLKKNIPFFDGQFYLKLKVGSIEYNLAGSHEFPGSSMYNKLHAQKRALWQRFPNADVIVQADKHQYAWAEEDAYGNEFLAGNRASPYVHLIQIGTAKAGPDPYTIRGWERGISEWPWLVLWPDQHKIKITRHLEDVWLWAGMQQIARAA